jgi:twinkle protein
MQLIPDDIDFSAYMEEPEQHRVLPASSFLEQTAALFYPPADKPKFATMLWEKARTRVQFRPGEVSLWAGVNGHGKSMFLSQVSLDLCHQGERVMSASFEMTAPRQMQRMCRQAYAGDKPPMPYLAEMHRWTDNRLWIYDHMGAIDWRKLMAVLRYAHKTFGITQFVIDSLMKCVRGEDDYNGQKDFVNDLCSFAQANQVHVHLVHHVRKGESEIKAPGKFDIRGASSITDLVDNVFIVWRNKRAGERDEDDPGCQVAVEKQRHGEFEGKLGFWFDKDSQQYLEQASALPVRYNLKAAQQPVPMAAPE